MKEVKLALILVTTLLISMSVISGCNTVKGTLEGTGKDIQSITGGSSSNKQTNSSQQSYKKSQNNSNY